MKKLEYKFVLFLFFLSGMSSLIYELVWTKTLTNIFGKTTIAVTLVISSYMAGLSIGTILGGFFMYKKIFSPILLFAYIQTGIGISALIVQKILVKFPEIFKNVFQIFNISSYYWSMIIFLFSFFSLLAPTIFMGATFPVISTIFVKNIEERGKIIGLLYTMNTFGAIIGVALAGYYLIGKIGQFYTYLIAVCLNIFVALIFYYFSFNKNIFAKEKISFLNVNGDDLTEKKEKKSFILVIALLSGICSMAFEVLSERVLSIQLLNSTYSFTSILVIYLSGITFGSYLYSKFFAFKNSEKDFKILTIILILTGLYILFISSFLNRLPYILMPFYNNLLTIPFFNVFFPGLSLSSIILLVPSIFMGITFPLLCKLYSENINIIGLTISQVYFLNTIGSIIGPIVGAFILIPLLGIVKGFLIIGFIYYLLSLSLLFFLKKYRFLFLGIVLSILPFYFFTKRSIRDYKIVPPSFINLRNDSESILYYKETIAGTVVGIKDKRTKGLFINNNAACGVTYDAIKVVKMLGHVPFLYNPEIKNVLIIGFGIGVTTSEVAKHSINKIDCVEIVPGVKEAAVYFSDYNNNIIENKKLNFIPGDGRTYLYLSKDKYDLISCDPIHPALNSSSLYTKEYFELCKAHLSDNGIVSQYLPLHKLTTYQYKSILKTFCEVFPYVNLWLGYSHTILIGTSKKFEIEFDKIIRFVETQKDSYLDNPYQIAISLIFDDIKAREFSKHAEVHTDNRPFIEFFSPDSIKEDNWHLNLKEIRKFRCNITNVIKKVDHNELNRYLKAQELFFDAMILKNKGFKTLDDMEKVIVVLKRALEINPENREIKDSLNKDLEIYYEIKEKFKIF